MLAGICTPDYEIKVDKPFFSSLIEKGFSTNVDVMKQLTSNLDSKSKLSIDYYTLQVVVLEPNEIDIAVADSLIDEILIPMNAGDPTVLGYFIYRSVNLNAFSYTRFLKIEGGISANGMAFQAGGDIFYKSSNEENAFEVVLKGITRRDDYFAINKTNPKNIKYLGGLGFRGNNN